MPSGRKTIREEFKTMQMYADLSVPYFRVLKENLESDKLEDKKWAVERLTSAFVKMIPQDMDITSGGNSLTFTWQTPQTTPQLSFPTNLEAGNSDSTNQDNAGTS